MNMVTKMNMMRYKPIYIYHNGSDSIIEMHRLCYFHKTDTSKPLQGKLIYTDYFQCVLKNIDGLLVSYVFSKKEIKEFLALLPQGSLTLS